MWHMKLYLTLRCALLFLFFWFFLFPFLFFPSWELSPGSGSSSPSAAAALLSSSSSSYTKYAQGQKTSFRLEFYFLLGYHLFVFLCICLKASYLSLFFRPTWKGTLFQIPYFSYTQLCVFFFFPGGSLFSNLQGSIVSLFLSYFETMKISQVDNMENTLLFKIESM